MVQFRGQPILPWDIQLWYGADGFRSYTYEPTPLMTVMAMGYLLTVILCVKLDPRQEPEKWVRLAERGVSGCLAAFLFVLLFPVNVMSTLAFPCGPGTRKPARKSPASPRDFLPISSF